MAERWSIYRKGKFDLWVGRLYQILNFMVRSFGIQMDGSNIHKKKKEIRKVYLYSVDDRRMNNLCLPINMRHVKLTQSHVCVYLDHIKLQ